MPPSPTSAEEPRAPLPVPYEAPWRRLAGDLAAVIASAGLRTRELWRRNGKGSLRTPSFWPSNLAPLFWPLLLAFGLILVLGSALRLPGWWHGLAAVPTAERTEVVAPPGPVPAPERDQGADDASSEPMVPPSGPSREDDEGEDQAAAPPPTAAAPAPQKQLEGSAEAQPLLLEELVGADPPDWMVELEPWPAEGLLRLRLTGGYGALSQGERLALADQWLARGRELGYERLELLAPSGRLLARPAQVGSGMILLDADSTPP